jgi:ribonuclease BN (tRNA processing enzyme)
MDAMNYNLVESLENIYRSIGNDRNATIFYDIREYHPDVQDIADFANEQQVVRLALTHYAPSAQSRLQMRRIYVNPIKAGYDGEIIAGGDGTTITIPLD